MVTAPWTHSMCHLGMYVIGPGVKMVQEGIPSLTRGIEALAGKVGRPPLQGAGKVNHFAGE